MKKLLSCFLLVGFAAYAYAQEPATPAPAPAPAEEDVVYFKDGGVLRGEIVGTTKTTGRIQLRDGSIFVYKRASVKMASKQPLSEDPNTAKEDSMKMVMIAKKVIESETEKRKQEEEIRALQNMINANKKDKAKPEDEGEESGGGFRMYSAIEVLGGIGAESLPKVDTAPAMKNKQRIVGFQYAIGGRTDYFFVGLNLGLHQTYRNLSSMASMWAGDTIPTTLLSLPVGLDMRVEFVPQGVLSPYFGVSGAYALSLTEGVNDYIVVNPTFGLRFGRKISSLISGGYQLNMDGGNITHYITLRLGLVF